MTTTVTVLVREDSNLFHGKLADVNIEGDGDPEQFWTAIQAAMLQARRERVAARLLLMKEPVFAINHRYEASNE